MKVAVLNSNYQQNQKLLDDALRIDRSFDLVAKDMMIGSRKARLYFVDGFAKDAVVEKIMEFLLSLTPEQMDATRDAADFSCRYVSYLEADIQNQLEPILTAVLSGTMALLVEGYSEVVLIDSRTYPARGVEEPDDDRVLRGSHEGFVETLVSNTALVRRRIRDPNLTMEIVQIGEKSKTDVVLCYLKGKADDELVRDIRNNLGAIRVDALSMSQESLAECLVAKGWWNPFPKVRYTQRPDTASASVTEGGILIIVDNSPSVMVLPTRLWDFTQETNDYYFPPLVGSYLRIVRMIVFLATLLLTPTWFLLVQNPQIIPHWLDFIRVDEPNSVPLLAQLILVELIIDALKLASLNTPSALSNSFSVVGALILGEFAVKAKWFVPEVVLYMAFVAIADFAQPSFELGYTIKLFRMILLILSGIFGVWGYIAGLVLMLIAAITTPTITGRKYLYPLIPFNGHDFLRLMLRLPIYRKNR